MVYICNRRQYGDSLSTLVHGSWQHGTVGALINLGFGYIHLDRINIPSILIKEGV